MDEIADLLDKLADEIPCDVESYRLGLKQRARATAERLRRNEEFRRRGAEAAERLREIPMAKQQPPLWEVIDEAWWSLVDPENPPPP